MRYLILTPLALLAGAAQAQSIHQYSALALSPKGDTIAAVEQSDDPARPLKGAIVLRAVTDGHILRTIDPCATCSLSGLTFSPTGTLASLSRD